MPSIGLDISAREVRVARFTGPTGTLKPKVVTSLPITTTLEETLAQVHTVADTRFVRAAIPEDKAYVYIKHLADIDPEDTNAIRSAIEFSLEEDVPLSPAEVIFDVDVIPQLSTKTKVGVSVSVLPLEVVYDYSEKLSQAGLIPISFHLEAKSVARAVVKDGDESTVLVAHIQQNKTSVCISSNHVIFFTSALQIGHDTFKLFSEKGTVKISTTPHDTLELSYGELSNELIKIISYWRGVTQKDGRLPHIDRIIIVGPGADEVGLADHLSIVSGLRVEVGNVWTNVYSLNEEIPSMPFDKSLSYASAIGLALPRI